MPSRAAIDKILSQEWLCEGIWCVFCGADRADNRVGSVTEQEPHKQDCPWIMLREAHGRFVDTEPPGTGQP